MTPRDIWVILTRYSNASSSMGTTYLGRKSIRMSQCCQEHFNADQEILKAFCDICGSVGGELLIDLQQQDILCVRS